MNSLFVRLLFDCIGVTVENCEKETYLWKIGWDRLFGVWLVELGTTRPGTQKLTWNKQQIKLET
jgi:hypothetical protein